MGRSKSEKDEPQMLRELAEIGCEIECEHKKKAQNCQKHCRQAASKIAIR